MIKDLFYSLVLYIACLIIISLYCLIVYIGGKAFWAEHASGSLIIDQNQQIRGSKLLAQATNSDIYFIARPTYEIDSNCDVALYNETFKLTLMQRFEAANHPYDVSSITPSASLLDPYITMRDALLQAPKIASARNMDIKSLTQIIKDQTLPKSLPFFEVKIVNTTILNAILDG
ncbi:MAG: potassium-transporting ATPase subunit C, partial [Rickettsiaceae bacterium]|nr:potassium-transporting ATPase subunit C [Rickettsiaceae bacterium]